MTGTLNSQNSKNQNNLYLYKREKRKTVPDILDKWSAAL